MYLWHNSKYAESFQKCNYHRHRGKTVLCFVQNFPKVAHHLIKAILSITALETHISDYICVAHIRGDSIASQLLINSYVF